MPVSSSMQRSTPAAGHVRWFDKQGWRKFFVAIGALGFGFVLAIYSNVAAEQGRIGLTALCASMALLLSGYVAVTAVPYLARRASLEWLRIRIDYQLTRQGMVFILIIFLLAIAGLNTGNNLLYLVVASFLAAILMSGVVSLAVLTGLNLEILPEHVFARRPVPARIRLRNIKKLLPSFSVTVSGSEPVSAYQKAAGRTRGKKSNTSGAERPTGILREALHFPFIPAARTLERKMTIEFPRRGIYREKSFTLSTRFPFGFLEKRMAIEVSRELVVYPSVEQMGEGSTLYRRSTARLRRSCADRATISTAFAKCYRTTAPGGWTGRPRLALAD